MVSTSPTHEAPSRDEQLELVDRICASGQLRRSARLREFLKYVSQQSIDHPACEIPEQQIGVQVFGRADGYDTSQDNIVRVNATELRKRLEAYFAAEGAEEKLLLGIPRGSYVPRFGHRLIWELSKVESTVSKTADALELPPPHALSETVPLVVSPSIVERSSDRPRIANSAVLPWALAIGLAVLCLTLFVQNRQTVRATEPWRTGDSLPKLWKHLFTAGDAPINIVLADASFALAEDIAERPFSLDEYLNYRYREVVNDRDLSDDRRADLAQALRRNNGSFGDFRVASHILSLAPMSPALHLRFAREFTPEQVKQSSAILIGSRKSNPWVELFASQLNFDIQYGSSQTHPYILNRTPIQGEKRTYTEEPDTAVGYSIVSFLPALSQNGSVLILAGTDSRATDAAGEFVTSDARLSEFRRQIGQKEFPYFEVLLKTSTLRATPIGSVIVAYRLHGSAR